ncbi:MAG: transcriptional repressor [Candidatus Dadabacteria bacterium]|nr:MAG: transcriptional repressor [Candidatus Dadabacteria bacterium]
MNDKPHDTGEPDPAHRAEAIRQFEAFLRRKGLKQTRQRELILSTFLATDEHLTADELYRRVQNRNPEIGFATVYRTLHLIVDSGIAREREFLAGKKYYEHVVGETREHHHLICRDTDRIVEFYLPDDIRKKLEAIAREHDFELTDVRLELFGRYVGDSDD